MLRGNGERASLRDGLGQKEGVTTFCKVRCCNAIIISEYLIVGAVAWSRPPRQDRPPDSALPTTYLNGLKDVSHGQRKSDFHGEG